MEWPDAHPDVPGWDKPSGPATKPPKICGKKRKVQKERKTIAKMLRNGVRDIFQRELAEMVALHADDPKKLVRVLTTYCMKQHDTWLQALSKGR